MGQGPYEAALRKQSSDLQVAHRVEIRAIPLGDRPGMADALSRAALVTLLSEYETHPIAVLEALAFRRSILVADTSGLHELATKGLVRAIPLRSTSQQVATAVLARLAQPLQPEDVVLPTWDTCTEALLALYDQVWLDHAYRTGKRSSAASVRSGGQDAALRV
jgi:glycogen(starch) synthase